jgi:hypothetical protein
MSTKHFISSIAIVFFLSSSILSVAQNRMDTIVPQNDSSHVNVSLLKKYPISLDSLKGGFLAHLEEFTLVQKLLVELIELNKDIIKFPKPAVLLNEFSNSSVNFRVLVWTNDFDSWTSLKSSVLLEIFECFKKNKITIPFPQQDIHVKTMDFKGLKEVEDKENLSE